MSSPSPSDVTLADGRYELDVDGETAVAVFQRESGDDGDTLVFVHTEVPRDERGQGVASTLIEGALADVRDKGETIVPLCPYVAAYVRRHPDVQDLVAS